MARKESRIDEAGEPIADEPTQLDVDEAVAAHLDAERNAQEAALELADEKERDVHGVTVTRSGGD
jgi:hypothetical protein